ncbi:MAG: TonB-dependent receptor [Blastocatellia bacterium]|nr:TonB-dependent receptor [Blastocatellia bacterium]
MQFNPFKISLCLAMIAFAFGQISYAQGTRGTIRGTVTDPNNAIVPNATVQLIDAKKGTIARTATTNENGEYQFTEIEPSTYRITITAQNFAESKLSDFTVEPNRNLVLDATLSVTAGTTEVQVSAGAEQIDRESPTLGTTVENRRVEGLPLNGRNVLNLATLQPGITVTNNTGTGQGTGFRVNGSRSVENNVMLDGSNNNEVATGGILGGITRPDAIQEFRLLTSNFEAEFGRNTGSIVNLVTKSGTNEYHGNARFFYRPTFLSAANFFDNALAPAGQTDNRQPFERKEFGFNVGGPVPFFNFGEGGPMFSSGKNRTFFFADYERRWQKLAGTVTVTGLPTPAELRGDFSGLGRPIYDPLTATAANPGGNPFPGNIIPDNRISPIAKYYLQFFPTTDATGRALVNNDTLTLIHYFTGRFDHNFSPNHLLNFTYNYQSSDVSSAIEDNQGADIAGFGTTDLRNAQNYAARYTSIFGSNIVNTFLFSYARNDFPSSAPINTTTPSQIGFTANFVANPNFAGPPDISFFDRNFRIGNAIQGPQARLAENFQVQNALSWVVGNHRLKFGGDYVKYKQGQDFLFINNGSLFYSADGVEGSNTIGDDFADFLIGNTPIAAQYGSNGRRDYRQDTYAFFAQDTWRVSKQLTLSLGVRYEYVSPLTDKENRVTFYRNLPGITSQQLVAGTLTLKAAELSFRRRTCAKRTSLCRRSRSGLGGTVPAGGIKPDRNNFAPRLGFAYSFTGNESLIGRFLGDNQTVLRGGIGWYYGAVIGDTALQQLSATGYQGTNAFYFPGNGTLANPFGPDPFPLYRYLGGDEILGAPNANPFLTTTDIPVSAPLSAIAQPLDPFLKTPIVTQYNLTIERSFAKDYVLGISYVGNRGRKLYVAEEINPALGTLIPASARIQGGAIPTPSTSNLNLRRVNNDVQQSIRQLATKGRSAFDSMQVNFQKRFSDDGLTFQLAYTFSKSLADTDTQRGTIDILNQREGWGKSLDDHPHRFCGQFYL